MKSLNINITENFNGSFINISKISDMDFIQLDNYVEISYKNNIENEERLKEIERLSNEVNSQLDNNIILTIIVIIPNSKAKIFQMN